MSSSSSSSSTSSSSSSAVHLLRLREAHKRMLAGWKGLLTSHPNEAALQEAFLRYLDEYPDAPHRISGPRNDGSTMLSVVLPKLFPTLANIAPDVLYRIVTDIMDVVITNTQEELDTIVSERLLHAKFMELDKLVTEAEKAGTETRPPLLDILPEEEYRSHSTEIKLTYEKQLTKIYETLKKENEKLDHEVMLMDNKATLIKNNVETKTSIIADISNLASHAINHQHLGTVEVHDDEEDENDKNNDENNDNDENSSSSSSSRSRKSKPVKSPPTTPSRTPGRTATATSGRSTGKK